MERCPRSNTLFGGRAAVSFGVDLLLAGTAPHRRITLLDVGAGGGDIARFIARRAARGGIDVRPVALDRHPAAATLCRDAGLPSVVADAWALPLAARSVDIVVASQLLHHFRRDAAVWLVRELAGVARIGVVIADLLRSRAAAMGIWLASFALGFHGVTRRDGVTSVRRGFTAPELSDVLAAAGVRTAVHRRPGFRVVAAWAPPRADY